MWSGTRLAVGRYGPATVGVRFGGRIERQGMSMGNGAARLGRRSAALVAVVAATVGALTVPASARPMRAHQPTRAAGTVAPDPVALPEQPINARYARQILERVRVDLPAATEAQVLALGRALDGGTAARTAVLGQLRADPWVGARVDDIFERHLGRGADPSGRGYWIRKIAAGSSLEQVELSVATSSEAWRRAGSAPAGYVGQVYVAVLGRSPDSGGRSYWVGRLEGGTSRSTFVRSLLRSSQRANRVVGATYLQYLGRSADSGGRQANVDRYMSAQLGELDLIANLLGSSEARGQGCDPFDTRLCLLPFPNDRFTVRDTSTATGRRVAFKREWLPKNVDGVSPNPQEWNRNDGFSVGQAALLRVPGIDLAETGAATLDDVAVSLAADAPIVVIDADTGERHPIFTELDANIAEADRAADQLLYIRPAINYTAGHRYVVALRNLKRADGSAIDAPASFATYRDPAGVSIGDVEARRPHMEQLFDELGAAGVGRDDLYLAWDFTVASVRNTTGRMLHIRDDALADLAGGAPDFTVTSVTAAPKDGVAKRVEGTFEVPLYLTGDGSPGQGFNNGTDGVPVRNGSITARFGCELPTLADGAVARPVIYGHGLFGDFGEVRSGPQGDMVRQYDMAYCATDWIGMSENDIGNAATILKDLSTFNTLADRSQQGILNTIVLGRLMTTADGFVSDPAFQHAGGAPVIDTSALFYDGNSQGGVIGGAFVAVSPDVEAGVLGVAGMNYSTLLERSVDFDPFGQFLKLSYPSAVDRVLGLQVIQMLWDRGETNGYAAHLTIDPLPATPSHQVLIHVALGDHQVAPFTAEVEARTAGGMFVHRPVYGPGRTTDVQAAWGLDATTDGTRQSALVVWDSGAAVPPLANVPPRTGDDPHEDPRRSPLAQQQKDAFLRVDGTFIEVCGSDPCTAPAT